MQIDPLSHGLPVFSATHEVYYDSPRKGSMCPDGLVVRTEADGNELLPCARVRVVEFVMPEKAAPSPKADKRELPEKTRKTDSVRSQNTQAVHAIMAAFGFEGKITPHMRKVCLELIERERAAQG